MTTPILPVIDYLAPMDPPTFSDRQMAWIKAGEHLEFIFNQNRHQIPPIADRINIQASIAAWFLGAKDV
jgi:hypothetical protein